jgi:penicillin-binding protein 1B
MARRRARRRKRARKSRLRNWFLWQIGAHGRAQWRPVIAWILVAAVLMFGSYLFWLNNNVTKQFEGKRWQVPARIYARPLEIYPGAALTPDELVAELDAAGYRPGSVRRVGGYLRRGDTFFINLRGFRFWDGDDPPRQLSITLGGGQVRRLADGARLIPLVRLQPALVGRIYPGHGEDRILLRLEDVPPLFIKALLTVEDRGFYRHSGISIRSMLRALMANIRARQTVQGGSTITQQLAKNFYLTPERTITRKLNEALIALLLEFHFEKGEILEAYLNEVYVGQQGPRAVHGFGLAAHFFFGRRLQELELAEMALLVALVRGPSYYNPRLHPQRAKQRRDLALDMMAEQEVVTEETVEQEKARPLGVLDEAPKGASRYPAFLDLVRRQLRRDYRDQDLRSAGLQIFTTLDPMLQRRAESALSARVRQLELGSAWLGPGALQGAVVLTRTSSAEVLAVVGGRKPREAGFNRALDAVRPIGSLVKPAVYLAALEQPGRYSLVTPIDDAPVRLKDERGKIWAPRNYDDQLHGSVPLTMGLANSYNLVTVNLGMEVGVPRVAETLERLGVVRPVSRYPSMLLGAIGLSPLEVTQIYQTIAGQGFRTPLRAIREITDANGEPLTRYPLSVTQSIAPGPVYLLGHALTEVMRSGTGRGAYRRLPEKLIAAGKTGTTDELRDSWFAGFTEELLAVVWLGRDDNKPTGLSGTTGALEVWSHLMSGIRTRSFDPPVPDNVVFSWVDPVKMGVGSFSFDCRNARRMPFIRGFQPRGGNCGEDGAQVPVSPISPSDRR